MEKFLDGLAPALRCQLIVHTFPDFKTLVDMAITLENERRSLEDIRKRKRTKRLLLATTEERLRFQGQKQGDPRLLIQGPSDSFMPGTKSSRTIQGSHAMLVEKKGTMLNSAQSRGTRPPSRTMVETIQPPSAAISVPTTTTRRVT